MRILVTGSSGFVGSLLVPRLLSDGHVVRALGRDPTRVHEALELQRPHVVAGEVEVVRGDALTGEGLAQALSEVEVAYYLIHSMENPSRHPPRRGSSPLASGLVMGTDKESSCEGSFPEREHLAAKNFATVARRADVERIVYLGGPLPKTQAVSRHLASRLEVERILLDAIPGSVALRASIVIGARSPSFRFMVRLVERLPVLALPAWRRFRTQPIDSRDVIEMLANAAHEPAVAGRSLDIAGPDVLTYGEMIARIAELMLVNRPALGLAVSATPIAARLAAAIAKEDPELILPLMESLQGDLLPADDRAAELLNVELHSFDSAVEHALGEWEESEPLTAR
jgi:uncharacterized protein YbjT (DUF2867 family)